MQKETFLLENPEYGYRCQPGNYGIDKMRKQEFPQLLDNVYLDHAGATVFAKSQVTKAMEVLQNPSFVYGNPHSNSSSLHLVNAVRRQVLAFFYAREDEYAVIFTSGATAALKLVGESFPWSNKCTFAHAMDSHTSVLGIRGYARQHGATVQCLTPTDLDNLSKTKIINSESTSYDSHQTYNLIAFPAECNFSGKRYDLSLIANIQNCGIFGDNPTHRWLVLLDAAKYVATHRLNLSNTSPDFVVLSFYKMFGYPTGLGALIVKRNVLPLLRKQYYGGGTVASILAGRDMVHLRNHNDPTRWEDGTISFLSILALKHGLDQLSSLSMLRIEQHTRVLTRFLIQQLRALRHWNKMPVCRVYGHCDGAEDGPIVTCNFLRPDRTYVGYSEVQKLANIHQFYIRTGCFCNPGACQWYLELQESDLLSNIEAGHVCGDDMDLVNGLPTGAVRVSLGYMTTYEDIFAWLSFVGKYFVARTVPRPTAIQQDKRSPQTVTLDKITVFPIKSCAGMVVEAWPVGARGLLFDREWAILDASTRKALTLKEVPELCFIEPLIDLQQQTLCITYRTTQKTLLIPISSTHAKENADHEAQTMRVCRSECKGWDVGDRASAWLSTVLGRQCRLVRVSLAYTRDSTASRDKRTIPSRPETENHQHASTAKIGFSNQAQYLLISRASVNNVNNALREARYSAEDTEVIQVKDTAFRANFMVDGCEAFAEDTWSSLLIGDVIFDISGPCSRCHMINVDSVTGTYNRAPLKVLSQYRRERANINFGQFLTRTCKEMALVWLHVGQSVQVKSNS